MISMWEGCMVSWCGGGQLGDGMKEVIDPWVHGHACLNSVDPSRLTTFPTSVGANYNETHCMHRPPAWRKKAWIRGYTSWMCYGDIQLHCQKICRSGLDIVGQPCHCFCSMTASSIFTPLQNSVLHEAMYPHILHWQCHIFLREGYHNRTQGIYSFQTLKAFSRPSGHYLFISYKIAKL